MTTEIKQLPEMVLEAPKGGFKYDKTKDGWKLEKDCGPVVGEPSLFLAEFLREGENCVSGDIMVARAQEMEGSGTGQFLAERMLEQADRIPVEWRQYYLVFTETVWVVPRGVRCVPYLRWGGRQWCLYWYYLADGWGSYFRVVRLRK